MNDEFDEEDLIDDTAPEVELVDRRPSNITQHTLLGYLVANFDVWSRAEPIIQPEYFDEEYRQVVEYMINHSNEFKQIPSRAILRMKTGVLLDQYEDAEDERTTQWLLEEIQTFCRHRATAMEIKRASQIIQK